MGAPGPVPGVGLFSLAFLSAAGLATKARGGARLLTHRRL